MVHLLQHPLVFLPSPRQQRGGPWKGREVLVGAGSRADLARVYPAASGNAPWHISDPIYITFRADSSIKILLCSYPICLWICTREKRAMENIPTNCFSSFCTPNLVLFASSQHPASHTRTSSRQLLSLGLRCPSFFSKTNLYIL